MISRLIDQYFIKQPRLRRTITRLLEGEREVSVEVMGTTLTVHSVKEHGYLRASRRARSTSLFRDEAGVLINLALLLADGDTFVDVGANVGLFCCTLARRSRLDGGRTRYLAFEANPDTVIRLRRSAESLGVDVRHCGISDRDGELEFVGGAVSHVFTTVAHANSYNIPGERCQVPCRRLDGLDLPGDRLVIKIDVEGQEREVLDGAAGLFAAGRVKAVYLDGYADQSLPDRLRAAGFDLFDGRTLRPLDSNGFALLAVARRPV